MTDAYFDSETYTKIDFSKTNIIKGEYDNCTVINCNFENIHTSNIQFVACDLKGAIFERTNLEKTNFKTAFNFTFELEKNRVKGAKFKRDSIDGLLFHYKIVLE